MKMTFILRLMSDIRVYNKCNYPKVNSHLYYAQVNLKHLDIYKSRLFRRGHYKM